MPSVKRCTTRRVAAGEIPSREVYADDAAIAFLDISPWHVGHTLVIPRRHVDGLLDDPTALTEIAPAITATAALLSSATARRLPLSNAWRVGTPSRDGSYSRLLTRPEISLSTISKRAHPAG